MEQQNPFLTLWKDAVASFVEADARYHEMEDPEKRRALLKTAQDLREVEDQQAAAYGALSALVWPEAERLALAEGRESVRALAQFCPDRVLRAFLLDYADHVELDDGFTCECCNHRSPPK